MTVNDMLYGKGRIIFSVPVQATVKEALNIMNERGIGAILVMANDAQISGIFSERDVARALPAKGGDILGMSVAELMTKKVITCRSSDSVSSVMSQMTRYRIRHVPVVDGGHLRGLISIGDVVKHRLMEMEQETEKLREYIATA